MGETVVLWVSRHRPLPAQVDSLRERLGSVRIVQLDHVPNAEHVVELARELGARYIVPVLPLSIIARLAEEARRHGFTILFARMEAIASTTLEEARRLVAEKPTHRTLAAYADGTVKVFEFRGFERLIEVKVVTEPW